MEKSYLGILFRLVLGSTDLPMAMIQRKYRDNFYVV